MATASAQWDVTRVCSGQRRWSEVSGKVYKRGSGGESSSLWLRPWLGCPGAVSEYMGSNPRTCCRFQLPAGVYPGRQCVMAQVLGSPAPLCGRPRWSSSFAFRSPAVTAFGSEQVDERKVSLCLSFSLSLQYLNAF